jgi:hypothetical protein
LPPPALPDRIPRPPGIRKRRVTPAAATPHHRPLPTKASSRLSKAERRQIGRRIIRLITRDSCPKTHCRRRRTTRR